jgi:hypothetical protein
MLPFHYGGHFDRHDFLDLSERPCRPRVQRPQLELVMRAAPYSAER